MSAHRELSKPTKQTSHFHFVHLPLDILSTLLFPQLSKQRLHLVVCNKNVHFLQTPVRAARHGTPSSPIALETMDAETTPQQQQYPNLNPYESSNGTSSSVEQTKNTVVSSKVRVKHTNTFASSSSSRSVISVPGQQDREAASRQASGQQQQQHTSGQHVTSRTTAGVNE